MIRAIPLTAKRQPLGQIKFLKTGQKQSGSNFREKVVIPIGFEQMTYSFEDSSKLPLLLNHSAPAHNWVEASFKMPKLIEKLNK